MFCQNCGTKNSDDAIFCEACGTKLEREPVQQPVGNTSVQQPMGGSPVQQPAGNTSVQQPAGAASIQQPTGTPPVPQRQPVKRQRKPVPVLMIVWIAEAVLLLAVICGAYVIAANGSGPERTALNYFINMASGDWEKAYEKLDTEETDFINAQMFAVANQYNYFETINNYEVARQPEGLFLEEESSLGRTVTINFRTKGDTQDRYYMVDLSRQPQNRYLLFENWKVGTSNLISRDYSINVPQGASVTVDGILLDESYLMTPAADDYGQVQYVIPQIFQGIHTITIVLEDRVEITDTVQIAYDNDSYYVDTMKYQPEVLKELIQKAGEDMQQIYQAAMEGKTIKTIEELFTTEEESLEEIRSGYERLLSEMNEGSSVPTQISFSNLTGSSNPYNTAVELSFEYQVDYTYEDWWSGAQKRDTYQGSDTWYFEFVKENGTWVLRNLGCGELYF